MKQKFTEICGGGVNVRQFKKQYAISLMEGRIVRSERT